MAAASDRVFRYRAFPGYKKLSDWYANPTQPPRLPLDPYLPDSAVDDNLPHFHDDDT